MKQMLGGVLVGVLVSGVIVGAVIPNLPAWARHSWIAWLIAAACIAGSLYLARRRTKTPPSPSGR